MTYRSLPKLIIVLFLFCFPLLSWGACSFKNGVTSAITQSVTFGTVVVQRDTPVGTVLASQTTDSYNGGTAFFGCTTAWTYRWEMSLFSTLSDYGNKVYATNIDGVGVRLTTINTESVMPYDQSVAANTNIRINSILVELIKTSTGAVGSGVLTTGNLARASVAGDFYTANAALSGTNTIVPVACSVTTPSISVPMGEVRNTAFSGAGSTAASREFTIPLNCDAETRVTLTLDAGSAGSFNATNGILNLDSEGESGTASGVGLQLLYNSEPVPLGTAMSITTITSDGLYDIPLTARYYQTTDSLTPGQADATATFTLTYQ